MREKKNEKKDLQMEPKNQSQNQQKGSPAMSRKDTDRHEKDNSDGAECNTSKKQSNSI